MPPKGKKGKGKEKGKDTKVDTSEDRDKSGTPEPTEKEVLLQKE